MAAATPKTIGKTAVKAANGIVNFTALTVVLLLVAVAAYAIGDSDQVYREASAARYMAYKPSEKEEGSMSFSNLQAVNPEVFSWLTVYGTNIDYPVTQSADNEKYVRADAFGKYSLSGAIFLDCGNDKNFQDFNSILYGHHMEKQAMFGEIGLFGAKPYFDGHARGNLYYNSEDHGLEFFAFVKADAYDSGIFTPGVEGDENQRTYLGNLLEKALYTRDIGVTAKDRILLLSTCSPDSTNGRDILVARISDALYSDPFAAEAKDNTNQRRVSVDRQPDMRKRFPLWARIVLPVILLPLIVIVFINRKKRSKEQWK